MTQSNERTLNSYEAHVQEYVDGTPQEVSGGVKDWIDRTLEGLPHEARIIEVGSAFGRDAQYIEAQGYKVDRTDATHGFVELLQSKGYQARDFNLITDSFNEQYDVVFADAVLLHFTREELELSVDKVRQALLPNGRFAFSLKQGEGERWSEDKLGAPRFFCYWTDEQITETLERVGFSDIAITTSEFGNNNPKWLHIVASK
ncbi:MAG: class I SAM-dependent methyltransferase [Candidatus Microsaccharimonas sossegonensis]|uniref:Class I SAM-dependent methyltransferase n=1 Tax=Candidatus Microsaccharimonas sossegonensis TaxID=2506948 RepID=A0A4V1J7I7_9BACT|nr:MAG: class I SAM-dependent methyltransferase [Candidatus Microsaccharimonas sossegonensis]